MKVGEVPTYVMPESVENELLENKTSNSYKSKCVLNGFCIVVKNHFKNHVYKQFENKLTTTCCDINTTNMGKYNVRISIGR